MTNTILSTVIRRKCGRSDPHDPDIILIKRIVALQGDHVKAIGYKNRYVKIPRGHCWIEGDNSNHSMDSNTFGPTLKSIARSPWFLVSPPGLSHKHLRISSPSWAIVKDFKNREGFRNPSRFLKSFTISKSFTIFKILHDFEIVHDF
ncbi:predicted protein [Nematostella vectensis]|uniref:Mitochondrial inner membrane protease subunit 2 n=1 Tax=Nematostella vectensis TaxID=45351 RepID=A7SSJ6_NEMVE|nr:predicted protein [Nematostella vectensis]|eukprot:XP_001625414.1 predicted protein [Nematostella vectensis]